MRGLARAVRHSCAGIVGMRWFFLAVVGLLGACVLAPGPSLAAPAPREFFVAPDGNDEDAGSREHPFASLPRALDAAEVPCDAAETVVWLRGGCYELTEPLVLKAVNRSSAGAIRVQAVDGEGVRIVGSQTVNGFRRVTDAAVLDRLDPEAREHVLVADLRKNSIRDYGSVADSGTRLEVFYRDKAMRLARWPNEGFEEIADVAGPTPVDIRGTRGTQEGWLKYESDRPSRWIGEPSVYLHGYWFWDWSDSYQRIESIDTATKTICLASPHHSYGYRKGQRYYALNLLCELDSPGEWYADRVAGLLYFWPPGPVDDGSVVVSVLPSLVRLEDCRGVVFRGITFEGARRAAVTMDDCSRCRIEDCTVRNVGGWGVLIRGGEGCAVRGCDIFDVGEGGVSLAGGDRPALSPAGHEAIGNHIHHFGRLQRTYRPAVRTSGVGSRVAKKPHPRRAAQRDPAQRERPHDRVQRDPPRVF